MTEKCERKDCSYWAKSTQDCCLLNKPSGCEDYRKEEPTVDDPEDMIIDGLDHYGSLGDD
jgi:hypothetical protein